MSSKVMGRFCGVLWAKAKDEKRKMARVILYIEVPEAA
jgi:hypothetical protein